jgi:trimeric autotransporter adhesin
VLDVEDCDRNRFRVDLTSAAFLQDTTNTATTTTTQAATAAGAAAAAAASEAKKRSSMNAAATASTAADAVPVAAAQLPVLPAGIAVDLTGQAAGLTATALIEAPAEPRLFVCERDGSATELLSEAAAERWQQAVQAAAGKHTVQVCPSDSSQEHTAALQHSFHVRTAQWHSTGQGLFAAVFDTAANTTASTTAVLPELAAVHTGASPAATLAAAAPAVWLQRHWCERPPLPPAAAYELRAALSRWSDWKAEQAAAAAHFEVRDVRSAGALDEERTAKGLVKRAYRAAKAQRRREKEKARAAEAEANVSLTSVLKVFVFAIHIALRCVVMFSVGSAAERVTDVSAA